MYHTSHRYLLEDTLTFEPFGTSGVSMFYIVTLHAIKQR